MRVLLLGATGFIGSEIARHLAAAGHEVIGVGRGSHAPPGSAVSRWIPVDLNSRLRAEDWLRRLCDIDAVVNASGALQSGARDRLARSQSGSIVALIEACEQKNVGRFIQISAPGAHSDASTEFMRTKAAADERLMRSMLMWTILRPGLVIGRSAYGGTALLRALAVFPLVVPIIRSKARIQAVALSDVARAVICCLSDGGRRGDFDLVEEQPRSLRELVLLHRRWLGLPEPVCVVEFPRFISTPIGWVADMLGWLGWRSPLRTTALKVLQKDVTGDPSHAAIFGQARLAGLERILDGISSGPQDRVQARLFLALPLIIGSLAILFLGSGILGLTRMDAAAGLLVEGGMDLKTARTVVLAGSIADLLLGAGILFRGLARQASIGMAALTLAYVIGAVIFRADLWLDPLGPMLKALPALVLALVAWGILEER